jgi:GT2 family glycosyltransferase
MFDIFVADTGSSDEEIQAIEELVEKVDNIKLIKYNYYNFAKINNDVVKNHIDKEYEFLLFCNNDVKLLNDVISGMLNVFKEKHRVGTVGARLHFADNTIQHGGVYLSINKNGHLSLGHLGFLSYYQTSENVTKVFGNTAGLMMISKFVFQKCEGFNENYKTCFEDVELNCKTNIMGLNNYCNNNIVAYHYESQTRGKNEINKKNEQSDFVNNLLPFINKNLKFMSKVFI